MKNLNKSISARPKKLFKEGLHPKEVSDYWHIFNSSNILNIIYWEKFFELTKNVTGSIVEFGVGRGRSLISICVLESYYRTLKSYKKKKIIGLDSFNGFPEPSKEDNSIRKPKKGEWKYSPKKQFKYNKTNIRKILKNSEIPLETLNELELVKGYFASTSKELKVDKIAIMHLDGDLYQSVKDPLDNLSHKISLNGIIVIDDYSLKKSKNKEDVWPGARLAVEEFLKKNKSFKIKESIRGTPYLIKKY